MTDPKASYCEECQHWTTIPQPTWDFDPSKQRNEGCAKGHKPRFYPPKVQNMSAPWGWKLVCGDFEPICK